MNQLICLRSYSDSLPYCLLFLLDCAQWETGNHGIDGLEGLDILIDYAAI